VNRAQYGFKAVKPGRASVRTRDRARAAGVIVGRNAEGEQTVTLYIQPRQRVREGEVAALGVLRRHQHRHQNRTMTAAPMPRFEHPCPECGHNIVNINDRPEPHELLVGHGPTKGKPVEVLGIVLLVTLAMYCLATDNTRTPTPDDFKGDDEL
jgi:hypothetical protein